MAKPKTPPVEPFVLAPGAAPRAIGWVLLGLVAMCAALIAIPGDAYYRWQQSDGTILFRARWIYERIHFDPTPIDVAVIGSSRMEASVRASELGAALSAKLGHPVHVVNFGLPQEGRDLHWTIASELLRNRPEVKLLLLSASPEAVLSHPGFRFLGDDAAIATAPALYNPNWADNLLTLPYRHLAYGLQALWPSAFGLSRGFDPAIYRARSFDPTQSFTTGDGVFVDRNRVLDPASAPPEGPAREDPKLRYLPLDQRYATERHFVRRIAALGREHGAIVAFLRVPTYGGQDRFVDPGFYHGIGPVLEAGQFGADPQDYMDGAHLNRHGTARLEPWLADAVAPILQTPERR